VSDRIAPYLPVPRIVRRDQPAGQRRDFAFGSEGSNGSGPSFDLDHSGEKSIGRLRGFQGNFGVFVRSYAYITSLGADGLTEASETAVLNANYLLAKLLTGRAGKHLPLGFGKRCMHEFVLTGSPAAKELQVKTLDIAKRLLDYGFHPPTIYFPLLVDEALMFEPTETETRESLDDLAEAIDAILAEAEEDPAIVTEAPYTTPVRRLDEAAASRRPVIRQPLG
jgi:glycine dehydrogenase subunit 2